jgi:hypothetical protein
MSKLIFTNNIQNYTSSHQIYVNTNPSRNMNFSVSMQNQLSPLQKTSLREITSPQEKPKVKTMKWGEPTWFLFHTLSEKIKEESFASLKPELIQLIYSICTNLPCPDCSNHAKAYLDKINFNMIQNKEQLINMFFVFHNSVNNRKGYPLFKYDELHEKYSKAITVNIIQNFLHAFTQKNKNVHMIANDMHRKRILNTITAWFDKNIQNFYA